MSSNPSPIETEVKIHWGRSAADARRKIEQSGYPVIQPRTLESDALFDLREGELQASGKLLRLRRTMPDPSDESSAPDPDSQKQAKRATVTYKGPGRSERYKSREEIEFEVSDADAFVQALDRLGYAPGFLYQKFRTKFRAAGEPGMVTLDETPIGVFLELEGPEYWIDATAERLGFDRSAYSTASYAGLYRQYRLQHQEAPANMIFENPPARIP